MYKTYVDQKHFLPAEPGGSDKRKIFKGVNTQKQQKIIKGILHRYINQANSKEDSKERKKMEKDDKQYKLFLKDKSDVMVLENFKNWVNSVNTTLQPKNIKMCQLEFTI